MERHSSLCLTARCLFDPDLPPNLYISPNAPISRATQAYRRKRWMRSEKGRKGRGAHSRVKDNESEAVIQAKTDCIRSYDETKDITFEPELEPDRHTGTGPVRSGTNIVPGR